MVTKIRAFEGNTEKLIPISDITGTIQRDRVKVDIASIVGNQVTLNFVPLPNSEFVFVNGLAMTNGAAYDYTLVGAVITFNSGVLTATGNVLINYSHN